MSRPRKDKTPTPSKSDAVTRKTLAEKLEFFQDCLAFVNELANPTPDQQSWSMWASARINTLELELC
jgi:hypothetical protein